MISVYFVNFYGMMLKEFTRQHEPLVLFYQLSCHFDMHWADGHTLAIDASSVLH